MLVSTLQKFITTYSLGVNKSHIAIAGDYFEGDMELTEEQKIGIQMSIDGVPTYGSTNFPNWPKRIPYAIDINLGGFQLFHCGDCIFNAIAF